MAAEERSKAPAQPVAPPAPTPTNGGDAEVLRPERIRAVIQAWGQTTSTPDMDVLHRLAYMATEAAIAHVGGELAKVQTTAKNWEIAYDKATRERDTYAGQAYAYVQECDRMDRELAKVRKELSGTGEAYRWQKIVERQAAEIAALNAELAKTRELLRVTEAQRCAAKQERDNLQSHLEAARQTNTEANERSKELERHPENAAHKLDGATDIIEADCDFDQDDVAESRQYANMLREVAATRPQAEPEKAETGLPKLGEMLEWAQEMTDDNK
jgi:chromosome segregation ATPase